MNLFKYTGRSSGSISLISILVISAFTLILIVGMSTTSISTYQQAFNVEASSMAYYAAEACLEESLIRLERDNSFSGTSMVIGADTDCTVSVSGSNPSIVSITVHSFELIQSFEAEVELTPFGEIYNSELLSWKEV